MWWFIKDVDNNYNGYGGTRHSDGITDIKNYSVKWVTK